MTRYEIIEAPSVLGLFPKGVEGLSQVLLAAGLAERLSAARGPLVTPPPYAGGIDLESGVRNAAALADYARALADEVGSVVSSGAFPIVLGGDCSILLGSLLALRRRGRYGLLFLDGHADFAHPSEDPDGEAASMDLALATGRGPKVVADIEDRGPLVRDEDAALLGYRVFTDGTDRHLGTHVRDTAILVHDLDDIRRDGLATAIEASLARVARDDLSGFFVHLDADVLDDAVMPAVDYRAPGGLRFGEVARIVSAALATGKAVGLELTIFNPALDPDGTLARELVDMLVTGLKASEGDKTACEQESRVRERVICLHDKGGAMVQFGGSKFARCSVPFAFEGRYFIIEGQGDQTAVSVILSEGGAPVFEVLRNEPGGSSGSSVSRSGAGVITATDAVSGEFLYKVHPGSQASVVFGTVQGLELEARVDDERIVVRGRQGEEVVDMIKVTNCTFDGAGAGVRVEHDGKISMGAPVLPELLGLFF